MFGSTLLDIPSLPECQVCEVTIQNKKGYVAAICRSPSQSIIEFESFLSGFEDMLSSVLFSKSQFTIILGDFNARSSSWWSNYIANPNCILIDTLMVTRGFKHLISDATHMLSQSLSCIDLIFTDQPNYVIDCGTHPFLNQNFHHQITFCKLNIHLPICVLSGISKNQIMVQLKELLNLWTGIFSFHIKMYMNKLLFSTKH